MTYNVSSGTLNRTILYTYIVQLSWRVGCRDERSIIENYFFDGFQYRSILRFLSEYHNIDISYRTLKRRLRQYGLARRRRSPSLLTVWNLIHAELQGPGMMVVQLLPGKPVLFCQVYLSLWVYFLVRTWFSHELLGRSARGLVHTTQGQLGTGVSSFEGDPPKGGCVVGVKKIFDCNQWDFLYRTYLVDG